MRTQPAPYVCLLLYISVVSVACDGGEDLVLRATPQVELSPATLVFAKGSVEGDQRTLLVENVGSGELLIRAITVSGSSDAFRLTWADDTEPPRPIDATSRWTVAPSASIRVFVAPLDPEAVVASTLVLDTVVGRYTVPIVVDVATPEIVVLPQSLDFGRVRPTALAGQPARPRQRR